MEKEVLITKIGRTIKGEEPSFGFALTDEGQGVYIPASIIRAMRWDEETANERFRMVLEKNESDRGDTPLFAKAIANSDDIEDSRQKKIERLEDEVLFHKLRGLMPWGISAIEAVRRAVAPYGDAGEGCRISSVRREMHLMQLSFDPSSAIRVCIDKGFIEEEDGRLNLTEKGSLRIKERLDCYEYR